MQPIFLFDEDVDVAILAAADRVIPAIDFISVRDVGLKGRPDREILKYAAEHDRVIVSCDRSTMTAQFYAFVDATGNSPGLVILPQSMEPGEVIRDLRRMCEVSDAAEYRNYITWLPLSRDE